MIRAVLRARPVRGHLGPLRVGEQEPPEALTALDLAGLVFNGGADGPVLTPRGAEVHFRLTARARRSRARRSPGGGTDLAYLLAGCAVILALVLVFDLAAFLFLLAIAALIGGGAGVGRLLSRAHAAPPAREAPPDARTADTLDGISGAMLRRAHAAVAAVLDSALHEPGPLLDGVRNRVVLAGVERSLAESLLRHSLARRRIAETPTPGERSRRAAQRARAALGADVAEVEARIRTLEAYADRVRAAELEERDGRAAAELDAVAGQVAEADAVLPQQNEALASLVEAQEWALRVAALSADGEPSP